MSEGGFENIIASYLIKENGYHKYPSKDYDKQRCLIQEELFAFLAATQPETLKKIRRDREGKFLDRLNSEIRRRGVIDVLRRGVKYNDLKVEVYYHRPSSHLSEEAHKRYAANRFGVCTQLYYSSKNESVKSHRSFL